MFTWVRAGGRLVYAGSLESLTFAMGIGGFIRGRWVNSGLPWESLASLLGSFGSPAVVGFTWVRPRGRLVRTSWLYSLGVTLWDVGFIRRRWVHSVLS